MERLAVIGVSQTRGGVDAVERFQARFADAAAVLALGFDEAARLATCNRFEAIVALPATLDCAAARRRLATSGGTDGAPAYAFVGEGALEHLSRVAASLESVNPGEDQVMRQVREAFAAARAAGTVGGLLTFAFESALRAAKRVRREVPLAPLNTSLFSLALPRLKEVLAVGSRVAIFGAGEMARLSGTALAGSGLAPEIVVVSREPARGHAAAERLGATWRSFEGFSEGPARVDAAVCATPQAALLDEALLARLGGLRIVVDLGVPRNVDEQAARRLGIEVVGPAQLEAAGKRRRASLAERLAAAEAVLLEEVAGAIDSWTDRELAPAIRRLRTLYFETIGEALPRDEAAALAHRFAHVPVKGLRALSRRYGLEAAETFMAATDEA